MWSPLERPGFHLQWDVADGKAGEKPRFQVKPQKNKNKSMYF